MESLRRRPGRALAAVKADRLHVTLVNRDSASRGLTPSSSTRSVHSARAARARHGARGFTAHWGSDGSVPSSRTRAGGTGLAKRTWRACSTACARPRSETALDPALLEQLEKMFMDEYRERRTPSQNPQAGASPRRIGWQTEHVNQPCLSQRFGDDWASMTAARRAAKMPRCNRRHDQRASGFGHRHRRMIADTMDRQGAQATSNYRIPEPRRCTFARFQSQARQVNGRRSLGRQLGRSAPRAL